MAEPLGIGDVVRWRPKYQQGTVIGKGPFMIIGKSTSYHAVNLDGSPLLCDDVASGPPEQRYYLVAANEVVKDVFLTAAAKAIKDAQ